MSAPSFHDIIWPDCNEPAAHNHGGPIEYDAKWEPPASDIRTDIARAIAHENARTEPTDEQIERLLYAVYHPEEFDADQPDYGNVDSGEGDTIEGLNAEGFLDESLVSQSFGDVVLDVLPHVGPDRSRALDPVSSSPSVSVNVHGDRDSDSHGLIITRGDPGAQGVTP